MMMKGRRLVASIVLVCVLTGALTLGTTSPAHAHDGVAQWNDGYPYAYLHLPAPAVQDLINDLAFGAGAGGGVAAIVAKWLPGVAQVTTIASGVGALGATALYVCSNRGKHGVVIYFFVKMNSDPVIVGGKAWFTFGYLPFYCTSQG
jgi:hypothetical protein